MAMAPPRTFTFSGFGLQQLHDRQRLGGERLVESRSGRCRPASGRPAPAPCASPAPGRCPSPTDRRRPPPSPGSRTFGFRPSSFARSSDMISSAAAPTLSGLELPAVTVPPSGMNAGFRAPQRLQAGVAADALVLGQQLLAALLVAAPGRDDLARERARVGRLGGALMAAQGELVLLLAADACTAGPGSRRSGPCSSSPGCGGRRSAGWGRSRLPSGCGACARRRRRSARPRSRRRCSGPPG